jgi:plastocyanin
MLGKTLQKIAKNRTLLVVIVTLFFSHFALSANSELVVEDQNGQKLSNAVVEVHQTNNPLVSTNLPIAIMDQVDKQFLPELIVVQKGQYVNFPNSDNIRHHVYSFSQAKPFQLKLYSGQPKTPIIFDQQGVVVLGCNIHDSMVGYIYVANSDYVYKTDKSGQVSLPATMTLPIEVSIWHPLQTAPLENKKIVTINAQKKLVVTVNTSSPEPRNTFGSKFKAGNE